MRQFAAVAMALSFGACGGGESLTVSGHTLSVSDQMYTTNSQRFTECPGLSTNQVHLVLADFAPVCPLDKNFLGPDPTIENEQLDLYLSLDAIPNFKLVGFDVNANTDCQIGGGPVYAFFTHTAPNAKNPDAPLVASGGHITVTQYDPTHKTSFGGKFQLTISGSTINGSFSAANCDH